jgi:hypothetical protein
MLENLNRDEACPGDVQEVLSADELEKALHALEVESFAVMMRHVQVSFAKPAVFPCYFLLVHKSTTPGTIFMHSIIPIHVQTVVEWHAVAFRPIGM